MKVTVYHQTFGDLAVVGLTLVGDGLIAVARVTAPEATSELDACELAFVLTQNIDGSWSQGPTFEDGTPNPDRRPNVEPLAPLHVEDGRVYGLRSSMTGDVMELENGQRFRVAMVGFDRLPAHEATA